MIEKSRTQKAALNTATAALSEIVSLICGLILPRLIIASFGSAYNGISSSATQFLSAISILNVGVQGATRVALYKALAVRDIPKCSRIIKATERYMRKVGVVLAVYIIILSIIYPIIIDTGFDFLDVSILIIAAGIGIFGQYFFGTAYTAFLTADQSVYITNSFNILATIANTILALMLIRLNCSIQIVKLGSAFVLFMKPLLQNIYVTHRYRIDKHCEPDNSALLLRKNVMAHSIANIVHDNTDMVVLSVFCNVKIVSVYTVYNLVMSALKKTQQVFTTGTEAVFGNMWAKGEIDKIKLNLGYYEYIVTTFVSIAFSTCIVMILPFVSLYTRGVTDTDYIRPSYAAIITIAQAWYCLRSPYLTLVQGAGHYKETKKGAYLEAGINLGASIVLVQYIGMAGVAIGTLIANLFRTLQYAVYIDNNIIKRGKMVFAKKLGWTAMNCTIVFLCTYSFAQNATYSWIGWVGTAVTVLTIASIETLLSSLIFYRNDLKGVAMIISRVGKGRASRV